MVVKPHNLLVIMSDEHNPKIAGYAGHPIIGAPELDTLAARGSRFTAAYTPSPICVPARASLATGLPVHRHRAWDNAIAYDGRIEGWAHALRKRGHHVAAIGKLHYRGRPDEDYGFTESQLASLTSKFPTRRNRELNGLQQGIKSAHQGNFSPDRGTSILVPARMP